MVFVLLPDGLQRAQLHLTATPAVAAWYAVNFFMTDVEMWVAQKILLWNERRASIAIDIVEPQAFRMPGINVKRQKGSLSGVSGKAHPKV